MISAQDSADLDNARNVLAEVQVAPSILSSNFARLGSQVDEVLAAGARVVHVDVMDGHFVPPITIGPLVAASIADQVHDAGGIVDVHLMIERPELQVGEFARAGADLITFHAEATPHVHRVVGAIKEEGCLAGVAINPGTPTGAVSPVAVDADMLLCMSVNPGWGGQAFIPSSNGRIAALASMRSQVARPELVIEVDGGVDAKTAGPVTEAGATVLVAGSAIFGADDPADAYRAILESATGQR